MILIRQTMNGNTMLVILSGLNIFSFFEVGLFITYVFTFAIYKRMEVVNISIAQ